MNMAWIIKTKGLDRHMARDLINIIYSGTLAGSPGREWVIELFHSKPEYIQYFGSNWTTNVRSDFVTDYQSRVNHYTERLCSTFTKSVA
jgi:hypothetical protein